MDWQTRSRYLKAMGIPWWLPKDLEVLHESASELETEAELADSVSNSSKPTAVKLTELFPQPVAPSRVAPEPIKANFVASVQTPDCSSFDWEQLQTTVTACTLCELHKTRTQTVFGTGNQQAKCMIIGEAPGAEEDRQGLPFVGKSGKLLTNMLAAISVARNDIYIANILKCRPPNNRDPKPNEAAACRAYLERQIALIKPELILVVGRIAAHNLLQTDTPLGRLRGSIHTLPASQVPVIVTYHPAYLLRQPAEKRRAWQDLQLARDFLATLHKSS